MPHGPFFLASSRSPLVLRAIRADPGSPITRKDCHASDTPRQSLSQSVQAAVAILYAGFPGPILGIAFDVPQVIYQGLAINLPLTIGWRAGICKKIDGQTARRFSHASYIFRNASALAESEAKND
jgi:hypothetical protein